MNIKIISDNELELIVSETIYREYGNPEGTTIRQIKSDSGNYRIRFTDSLCGLVDYVEKCVRYNLKHYKSKASTFGCCSMFEECSDAKMCVHENRLYSMACSYRHNLDAGRIFYGKNRNID